MNFESESCHGWTQSYAMLHLCKGLHVSQSESTLSPSGSSSCSSTPPRSNSKPLPVLRDYGSVRHTELWKWLWLDFSRPVSSEVPRLIRKNMQQCSRSHLDLEALEPICETAVGLSQSNSSLFKEGSQSAAVFTLVSLAMGAGCLSLPFMLKTAGIIPGLLMLFLGAVLAHLSLVVLMSCSRYTESDSFSKLVALTGTKRTARTGGASRSVDVVIAVYGIAAVLCYLMFIGDFFLGIVQSPLLQLNLSRETLIVIISVLVVWPLSLPRDLSALRHVCVLSVLAICLTAVAVALKAPSYAHIGSLQAPEADWQLVWWKSDPYAMLQSFSIALFSFAAHTNAVPVATSLKAADGASIWRVSLYSVCIELVFYLLMGLAGYVSFRGFTEQDFILNYRNDDMMMFSVRCIYGIVVCLGAPINLSPAASSIQGLLGRRGERDRRRHFMVVTSIIASCVAIALWCKQVADVIGLIGASFGSLIVLAWPAMIYRKALFDMHPSRMSQAIFYSLSLGAALGVTSFLVQLGCGPR